MTSVESRTQEKQMIFKALLLAIFILIIGGIGYFALCDIQIEQEQTTKTLPASYFNGQS
jgi:hypothetical protein